MNLHFMMQICQSCQDHSLDLCCIWAFGFDGQSKVVSVKSGDTT